jgi:DNA-binding response OmpR family regulator
MAPGQLTGRAVLLVEDEPLIALDITTGLQHAGAIVLAARTLDHGMRLAEHRKLSAAILDFALSGADVAALCKRLDERRIPFMFYSGRARDEFNEWPDAPVVSKPAATEAIVAVLADMFTRSAPPRILRTVRQSAQRAPEEDR